MKTFGKLLSEVAQPKAEDEIHFKSKHKIDRFPHSHAGDEVFKGSTKKTPKRRADYENGDDEGVYEAMDPVGKEDDDIDNDGDVDSSDKYLHARRKAISKAMSKRKKNEEVEQLDELSPNKLHAYIKGASADMKKHASMAGYDSRSRAYNNAAKNAKRASKRLSGIASASGRLADKANMAEDAWEEIPMMSRQLQFIMYAAQEIVSYLNDCDDMCVDPEEWFQNKLAHVHGQMMTLHGYIEGDRRMNMSMYGEETELDEVSFELAKRARDKGFEKMAKSIGSSRKKPSGAYEYIPATDSEMKDAEKGARQAKMASRAMTRAHNKKRTGRYEETELDEVTRSAIKRPVNYTDARGVTRTRMTTTRPVQHDEYGQEKIRESLEEAVKPGKLKLDDGSSVTVSKKDADLINQMFNDLNKKNRKMMQDTLMTDKAGYEEIVGFAREAL